METAKADCLSTFQYYKSVSASRTYRTLLIWGHWLHSV